MNILANKKKIISFSIVVFLLITAAYYFMTRPARLINYPPKNDTIVAFGDSLVQGVGATEGHDFVSLLSVKLGKPIINLGVSGETTGDGLARIDEVINQNPGLVLVLFGGNDYLKRLPADQTFSNLKAIVSRLENSGSMVVLLGIRGGILRDNFSAKFDDLARKMGVVYVPDVLRGLIGNREYMSDTIHPNDRGYAIIADRIYAELRRRGL